MKVVEKIVVPDTNLLAGKPIRVTKFKNNEVLSYNTLTKQWETSDVIQGDGTITNMVKLTQAEYDALSPPVSTTLYIIVG